MAGTVVNEGETVIGEAFFKSVTTDRTTLKIGLYTNSSGLAETTALGTITEPTGGAYASKTFTDANWTVTDGLCTYAQQTWTASGGNYSAPIYGYHIFTTGTTARLICWENHPSGPHTINDGDSYSVTPSIQIS